jgi:hypothetical protein
MLSFSAILSCTKPRLTGRGDSAVRKLYASTLVLMAVVPIGVANAQGTGTAHTPPQTDEEMIQNALSAAPETVARDAAVVIFDEQGKMRTLREGTNNFTCLPDDPANPANDPVCLDENGMAWLQALVAKEEPPAGKVGFGYMLQGGSTASNLDPYATEPPEGHEWHTEPPHVMILNMGELPQDYPQPGENPDMSQPWVMWAGTPYEHLMIPVE